MGKSKPNLETQLEIAQIIVRQAFKDKTDKCGEPYIGHIYKVEELVRQRASEFTDNSEYLLILRIIAILHDLLEDCQYWNEQSLKDIFNDEIIDVVLLLTIKQPQDYFSYIRKVKENKLATIVKIADLEHNMDLTRFKNKNLSTDDLTRTGKYHSAWLILN